jgi:hypothetical protein
MDLEARMTDTTRTVLIALGVSLLVVVLAPLLVCVGGMATGDMNSMMGNTGGMGRMDGMMSGRMPWVVGGLALVMLIAGVVSLVAGLRRR